MREFSANIPFALENVYQCYYGSLCKDRLIYIRKGNRKRDNHLEGRERFHENSENEMINALWSA